jgi:glycosyltransferase involved in cell wall biosynthesis
MRKRACQRPKPAANMQRKPVILQVIPTLGAGGAERTTIEVAEAVASAGGVALVASEGGRLEGELARVGGELIRFPAAAKNPLKILANARALAKLVGGRGVSLVHARSRAPAWSALIAARKARVPFVTTYHGIYNQSLALKGWYNGVMARGDLVIANSHYTAGVVRARHGTAEARLRVIPRGVDLTRFAPDRVSRERLTSLLQSWRVAPTSRTVLLGARLTRWKGQMTAIAAAARLANRADLADVMFVLAGDDQGRITYREELRARIAESGLGARVLLPGHCEDMPAAFAAAELTLVPSIEAEAFGRSSIEAQAMGCPVIVSRHGALPETLIDAARAAPGQIPTGWTFPPGDDEALASAIAAALSLPKSERQAIADAACRHAAAFSKQALQRQTLQVYDDLLGSSLTHDFGDNAARPEDSPPWSVRIPV